MIDGLKDLFKKAEPIKRYVSVVILDELLDSTVVILKNRPERLKGQLNAVGGQVEPGEGIYDAAVREVREECSLTVDKSKLDLLGNLSDTAYTWDVACFVAIIPRATIISQVHTATDEPVMFKPISELLRDPS